ncbi:MAG: DUF616 domain-containing protein [Methylomarinum sp.]|nr:DUF616 domain-containing protein [Methylomarinum sp.]
MNIPKRIDSRIDYYFFSDDEKNVSSPWIYKRPPDLGLNHKDTNRYVKIHPHLIEPLSEYDLTIYIDGSINIVGDVYEFASDVASKEGDLFFFEHCQRSCVYDEAYNCAFRGLESPFVIGRQLLKYRRNKFPANYGLFEANIIVRKKSQKLSDFMELWWNEYCTGPKRDQLSLTYLAWKENFHISSLGRSDLRFTHHYFKINNHVVSAKIISENRKNINLAILKLYYFFYKIESALKKFR